MLRKGIVALMIGVMSVGSIQAQDSQKSSGLLDLFRGPNIGRPNHQPVRRPAPQAGGVTHAVVEDAAKQVPEIRQTSSRPDSPELQPAEATPQPTPVQYAQPMPMHTVSHGRILPGLVNSEHGPHFLAHGMHHPCNAGGMNAGMIGGNQGGALYPAPKPGIPVQVGGTTIPTHALHPHEMLYAHRYKAMYGPYYYKVHGGWIVTPFGVWSKENWKLQGTQVDVKYKSHISPWARFHPPVIR